MRKRNATRLDAAHEWVREFNAIDQEMLKPYLNDCSMNEVTTPSVGNRVYVFEYTDVCDYGEIIGYNEEKDVYTVELDNGKKVDVEENDFDVDVDSVLPMWSTMWSFGDSADDYWLEEMDGIRIMSECGFRVYSHYELGYFFGINGCGYDFYEAHWLPLYNKRGLQWHDEAADKEQDEEWQKYLRYLEDWTFSHNGDEFKGQSPDCFDEWRENKMSECYKSLKQMMIDAGYHESEMYHHYSDLYVYVNDITKSVIEKWCKERGYTQHWHFPIFVDQITGKLMFDCMFQWY